jgi:heme exporter protein B
MPADLNMPADLASDGATAAGTVGGAVAPAAARDAAAGGPGSGAALDGGAACPVAGFPRTTAPVSFVRHAADIAWKDLKVELRSREIVYTMAFFGALLVVVFAVSFVRDVRTFANVIPGMLWVAVAFAGTVGVGRAFDRERENETMRALLLSPAPRLSVFLGKAASIAALIITVEVVVAPLLALFLSVPLFERPEVVAAALVGGAIGFSIVATVFAAMLLRTRARDVLLPVILYPILVPLFIAGTRAIGAVLTSVPDLAAARYWLTFLGIYDAAFFVISLWIFEDLVIE